MPPLKSSDEFYSPTPDGGREDADLHAELLDSHGGREAERAQVRAAVEQLRAQGVNEAVIAELYGEQ